MKFDGDQTANGISTCHKNVGIVATILSSDGHD